MRTLEEYLRLPYRIVLTHDEDEEGAAGYLASVEELPGCLSQGPTPEAAVQGIYDAMTGWISVALDDVTWKSPNLWKTTPTAESSC